MLHTLGLILFLGGALFALSETFPWKTSRPRPFLRNALRPQWAKPRANLKTLWEARLEKTLGGIGHPAGWTVQRLSYISVAISMAVIVIALVSALEGGGVSDVALGVIGSGLTMRLLPDMVTRFLRNSVRMTEIQESVQLLQTLEVYLLNGYSIKDALTVSAGALPQMGPKIRQALLVWGQGPYRAIDMLAAGTADESTHLAIAAIKQAVDVGTEQMPVFLQREEEAVRRSREALQKASQARKPLLYTLYLGIPIIAYVAAYMMPFGVTVAAQITHITGN